MNKLVIPPPPSWYENYILACAPDNTVIYASRNDIIVINPKPPQEPADIQILPRCHRERITSIAVCSNWGNPDKLAVSIGDDKAVNLLDITTCKIKLAHSGHTTRLDKLVGVTFAGHDRVISVSEEGFIVIWRWANNQLNSLSDLLGSKVKVTCVSSCPHATWLTAFGLRKGDILVTDLRKTGRVLHRLKGHDTGIISLSWCPTPYNVFPKTTRPIIKKIEKATEGKSLNVPSGDVICSEENLITVAVLHEESAVESICPEENQIPVPEHDESPVESICPKENQVTVPELDEESPVESICPEESQITVPELDESLVESICPKDNQVTIPELYEKSPVESICPKENQITVPELDESLVESICPKKNQVTVPELVEGSPVEGICPKDNQITVPEFDESSVENICPKEDQIAHRELDEESPVERICPKENQITVPELDESPVENICPKEDQIALPELDEEFPVESICAEENQITVPELDKASLIESISPDLKNEDNSTEDVLENSSEHKTENVISEKEVENTPPKLEDENQVVKTEKLIDNVVSDSITQKVEANALPQTLPETLTNQSDSSEKVEASTSNNVTKPLIVLGFEMKCLPLQTPNKKQKSQSNGDGSTVQNIASNNSPAKINLASLKTEDESPECSEHFQNQCEQEESPKEFLLASSARGGRSIIIWRAGTDGIKQIELNLPGKPRAKQRSYHPEEKSWITLCWVTPNNLLSSSPKGELLQWNLAASANTKGAFKWRLIHSDHHSHLFGIAAPIRLHASPDDEDWRERNLLNAWTVGKDRYILNTSLCSERKTLASYPTIAGSIYCLSSSIIYPSKIAIGAGEGSCRLWDLSRPHLQYNVMTQFSDKSQNKIVSLAWHPTKESILAFGTTDGRIGFMDPCNTSKSAIFLVQYINTTIHRLDWGPCNGNREHLLLYAVTGGKLIAYDIDKRLDAPILFNGMENATQVSWKPDYSVCAVAFKTGSVSLLSPEMKVLTTFYLQNKAVRWITWHPEATVEDDGVSPYAHWLAVATNDVTVYDCNLNDGSKSDYSERIVAVFNEPTKFVDCLSWSTFQGGKLAAAGDDGIALVWDVKTKTLLHTCVSPNEIFISVLWSPVDGDYIITGAKSSILKIWKLSENPPQEKLFKKEHHKILKLKEGETSGKVESDSGEELEEKEVVIEKPKKTQRKYVLGGLIEGHNRNSSLTLLRDCKRLFAIQRGEPDFINTASENGVIEDNKELDIVKIFGNDHNLDFVLDLEKNCCSKKKLVRASSHISMWQGNTADVIKEAILTKCLNPWVISMAPTISHELYLEACEAYADQLAEDFTSNIYESVSYYLACHKLVKAIDLLCTSRNYLEAVVLAKCRLVSTDPLIPKIIERWAQHTAVTGCFEVAAQCYIVLNRFEDAAKILFRRTDEATLKFCAELAKHCDDKDFLDAVLFKLSTIENTEEDSPPEVPLLSRVELELSIKKLSIAHEENNSEGALCVKIELDDKDDLLKENGTVMLGDGQSSTSISCPDVPNDLKTVDENV